MCAARPAGLVVGARAVRAKRRVLVCARAPRPRLISGLCVVRRNGVLLASVSHQRTRQWAGSCDSAAIIAHPRSSRARRVGPSADARRGPRRAEYEPRVDPEKCGVYLAAKFQLGR